MKFEATAVFVDDVRAVLDFYYRAFGFEARYFDEALGYGELQTGGTLLAFVSHRLGAQVLPGGYLRPDPGGQPFGISVPSSPPMCRRRSPRRLVRGPSW